MSFPDNGYLGLAKALVSVVNEASNLMFHFPGEIVIQQIDFIFQRVVITFDFSLL